MSRSYRKPFAFITGVHSRKKDRTFAARGVRRKQDAYIQTALSLTDDWDDFLIPHQLECNGNDPWGWSSDGHAHPIYPYESGKYYHDGEWWEEHLNKYYRKVSHK